MPKKGFLPLHSSAIEDERGRSLLMIGGPRSGKTALCFDQYRLVGDGQMIWYDGGLFSVFAGCYPRLTNLVRERQPQLTECLKFGAVV